MAFHGGMHGNLPEAISPWENRSHTKRCFTVDLPMASVTATMMILLLLHVAGVWEYLEYVVMTVFFLKGFGNNGRRRIHKDYWKNQGTFILLKIHSTGFNKPS